MEVRAGTRDDLDAIQLVALRGCTDAIGALVPDDVVVAEASRRYSMAALCEHILARQLLVGVDTAERLEVVCMVDERDDHAALTTVLAPQHPARDVSGVSMLEALRSEGWSGALVSDCVLGNLAHERFHESAGFSPGDVEAIEFAGFEIYRRWWWIGPDDGHDR